MNGKTVFRIAARELVAFALRSGDLHRRRFGSLSAVEGIIGHQKVQRARGESYKAEVSVRHTHELDHVVLEISGRIDGLFEGEEITVEEIKTTRLPFDEIGEHARALHLSQGKLYAYMVAHERDLKVIWVQLTYLNVDDHTTNITRHRFERQQLDDFFAHIASAFLSWVTVRAAWLQERDATLQDLPFPFDAFRPGQRRFAAEVFRAVAAGRRLFAQAPTGIGKTMGALYPALKALGEGKYRKLFFLTAKTMGAQVAASGLAAMRTKGLKLKAVHLTARDKICFEAPCDPEECPFALGFYDRLRAALDELFTHDQMDRATIEAVARTHTVCPFELSLEASSWCDLVVCDYNYAFDPGAHLHRFFEEKGDYVLLIDEAHNLVDRARGMYSAALTKRDTLALRRTVEPLSRKVALGLKAVNRWFLAVRKEMEDETERVAREVPAKLLPVLHRFCAACEEFFAEPAAEPPPQELMDYYFEARRFIRTAEFFDEDFRAILRRERKEMTIKLYNLDPAKRLDATLKKCTNAVFFSATLTPFAYYARLLGGNPESGLLRLPSPFPPENLNLLIAPYIATRYRAREGSRRPLSRLIAEVTSARTGNYLVYFPSYAYLASVYEVFQEEYPHVNSLVQDRRMDDAARDDFLKRFDQPGEETLVGWAVMGGAFGEGIDLTGDRLIGVVVVGVGLPQVCLERDLIRAHFQAAGEDGFAFAYQYPGLNRVLQTAGRVIRSEEDRGVVCLVDDRFAQSRYRALFPPEWQPEYVGNDKALAKALTTFWT
ncbi:MAG: helicase C-terminal domain-containing protein [Acidobacteriota bacterium]|nr:helicase C-terminal domain-containing protein [Acidobacteriota bacterium]